MTVKVLHIITRMILGGAQENTLATVRLLSEKNSYDVTLVTGPAIGPEGSLLEDARKTKVKIVLIPELRREINPLFDTIAFIKLLFLMLRGKYDIIHTHSSKAGVLGRVAARLAGAKVIIHTIHGLPFHPYQNNMLNSIFVMLEKVSASASDRIITVCEAMKRKAIESRICPGKKLLTIYSGMDLKSFLNVKKEDLTWKRRELGIKNGEMVIGKVARLFPLKGHRYLIRAAATVVKTFPDVKFLLIGDGILREELESEVNRLGLKDKFIFTGLIKREDVPDYISVMDILVHTSLREGLPRVIPQALACGKPVICFDIDGAAEVVIPEKTGFLVPSQDTGRLSGAIVHALSNNRRLREMGMAGRSAVFPAFSAERMVEKIESLYRELVSEK